MNIKNILKIVVCLVLVCALMVHVSPIQAKASSVAIAVSATAILGVTAISLMHYCGFAMAPPDVDFIQDVGEELQEFAAYYINTGGPPGDDDDDDEGTNSGSDATEPSVSDPEITTNTLEQMELYTDFIGEALKGNIAINDPSIFGGFAGSLPLFKAFLKWLIQNGYFDRTVEVPVKTGWAYYNDLFLPLIPDTPEDLPYIFITTYQSGQLSDVYFTSKPLSFYMLNGSEPWFKAPSGNIFSLYRFKNNGWSLVSEPQQKDLFFFSYSTGKYWTNYDVLTNDSNSVFISRGAAPCTVFVEETPVEPIATVGPIIDGLLAGGMDAAEIPIPEQMDFEKIFSTVLIGGLTAVQLSLSQNANEIATGTEALTNYQQSITYNGTVDPGGDLVDPDASVPSESDPTIPSEPIPIDGVLSDILATDFFSRLGQIILSPFEWIWNQISNLFGPWINKIGNWFSEVRADIQALPSKFENWFSKLISGLENLPQKFAQWFNDLIDGVRAIPQQILEGIESLFFPSEDFLSDKVAALCAEFAFADAIVRTAQALHLGLANIATEPPVIYIDLGAFRGDYNIGGRVPFLDLRWYAEYKPTVDIIISAFLWICFAWRMFLKLPGIISGMPGDFVAGSADAFGLRDMLPTRNADYAQERAEIRKSLWKGRNK